MKNANTIIVATALSLLASGFSAHATSSTWTGTGANANWSTAGNWNATNGVPGSTAGVAGTSTDTATFSTAPVAGTNPIIIDSTTQNIGSITFSGAANGYVIGTTSGNSLFVTSGGAITQSTGSNGGTSSTNTVNAPVVIVGANGTYSFTNNSTVPPANGSGILVIGGAVSAGSTGNATLNLNGSNTLANAVSGVVSNGAASSLAVVKSGNGRWALSGANTYTGGTTITGGILFIANNSALGTGTVFLGDTTGASQANLALASTAASSVSINNAIVVQGQGSAVDTIGNSSASASNTMTYAGTITLGANGVNHGLSISPGNSNTVVVSGNIVDPAGVTSGGGGLTISGGNTGSIVKLTGTNNTFSGGITVNTGAVLLGNATAAGSGAITVNGGGFGGIGTLTIQNALNIGGNFLFGATNTSGGTLTVNGATTLNSSSTINISNGTLILGGVVSENGGSFGLATTNTVLGGALVLNGANTFSGGVTLFNNTSSTTESLKIGNLGTSSSASAIGTGTLTFAAPASATAIEAFDNTSGAAGVLATNNAQVWNGDFTYTGSANNLDMGTGAISLGTSNTATRTVTVSSKVLAEGGVISNGTGTTTPTVNLTKAGTGTLALYGANAYTGVTTISAGTLEIGNGGTTGSLASSSVVDNATLAFNRTDASTFSTAISGTGGVAQLGTGTTTLSGANSYAGVTTITNGTLAITTIQDAGSTTANSLGEPAVGANSIIGIGTGGTLQYVGSTSGSSNRAINMTGSTGGTYGLDASGGTTFALSGGVTTSGTSGVSTLALTGTGAGSESGNIVNGTGTNKTAVTKSGTGTWTLSGTNTYTGGTTFSNGVLAVGSAGALGTTGTLSFNGGTLQYGSGITTDYSARFSTAGAQAFSVDTNGQSVTYGTAITGTGSTFTLNDTNATTGTLTFTGANSYTGLTTVKNGELDLARTGGTSVVGAVTAGDGTGAANTATVKLKASGQIGTGSDVTINSDGDLDLNSFTDQVSSLTSNGGDVASSASGGTLTVTGATSFNGTGNIIAAGGTVTNGSAATLANGGGLTVNGTLTNVLNVGTGATVNGTGTIGVINLSGTDTVSSSTTLNSFAISVSGTGNRISAGTVSGNITFSGTSGTPASLTVNGIATGTVNVSAYSTLRGTGTTGAVTLGGTSSGINLVKSSGTTGTLTVGGLTTTGGGTLTFAIGTTAGAIDDINDTGTLVLGGSTSIVITNLNNLADGSQTLVDGSGTTYLLLATNGVSGSGSLTLATTSLDGQTLSLNQIGNNYYLTVAAGGVTDTGTDYFNGTGTDLTVASAYDTGVSTGSATPAAPSATSNLFFSANRNTSVTSGTVNSNMEVNSINFGTGGTKSNFAVSGTGTITVDATSANGNTAGSGITIAAGGGSASISNAIALGADQSFTPNDASSVLTVSGLVSGAHKLTKSGAGTVILSNASGNSYSGGTAVTVGRLLVTNTTGSGTGSGAVSVTGSSAILGGSGKISGAVTLSSGGMLYSGATASAATTGPGTGAVNGTAGGMTLSSALNVNGGTLTFALANSISGTLTNPAKSTSYLTANGGVNFTGTDSIDLVDTTTGGLSLRMNQAYLLVSASSSSMFSGLVVENSAGVIGLSQNGFEGLVLGVSDGGADPLDYTAITVNQFGADGVTALAHATTADPGYYAPSLYLINGDLEVVPEPGTWAMMIGGLALLIVTQRRRASKLS